MNLFKYIEGNTDLLLNNIEGKKILVLGSGPSATDIDWTKEDWEVLVTTSFFYMVPEVLEQKPLHVTLSDIVDLKDERLLNYLDENPKCTIAFEPKASPFYNSDKFGYKSFKEKYKSRIVLYNIESKIGGKEGVAGRVCWPVLTARPKSLMICGIDGISKHPQKDPPNFFRGHHGTPDHIAHKGQGGYSYNVYKKHFYEFGKRLYQTAKKYNIPVTNLGKGKPYNMITKASIEFEDLWEGYESSKTNTHPPQIELNPIDFTARTGPKALSHNIKLAKTAFIVQARLNSERVPKKMIKPFVDTNLFELILTKLLKSKIIPKDQIYTSVHETELKNISKKLGIKIFDRSKDSANNDNSLKTIYEWHDKLSYYSSHSGKKLPCKYVVLISGCNPLLTINTIDDFVKQFLIQQEENLFAVTEKKQYYWNKKGALITPWPKDQTIMNTKAVEPTYEAAHVLYASKLDMIKDNRFMGEFEKEGGIKLFTMPEIEAFDIDHKWQFTVAETLYKNFNFNKGEFIKADSDPNIKHVSSSSMFVIPCKYNSKSSWIYRCISSIRKHTNIPILIVDSNSKNPKEYADYLQNKYDDIHLEWNNKSFGTGALWRAYKKFPNVENYFLIHDSTEIFGKIKLDQDVNGILVSDNKWLWPKDEKHNRNSDLVYKMLNKSKLIREKLIPKEWFKNSNIFGEKPFRIAIGPMFLIKRKVLDKLVDLEFNKVLPSNKKESICMEWIWGMVFSYLGYNIYENALLKGKQDWYAEIYNKDKRGNWRKSGTKHYQREISGKPRTNALRKEKITLTNPSTQTKDQLDLLTNYTCKSDLIKKYWGKRN